MEFFNCKSNNRSKPKGEYKVLSVDINRIENVKNYPFSVVLNNISKFKLFSLINLNPLYVGLVKNKSNLVAGAVGEEKTGLSVFGKFVIEQLENFNIIVDLGRLNTKSIMGALKIAKKRVIVTDAILSSCCGEDALDREIEEELVKRKSLLILNIDNYCLQTLVDGVINFISRYKEDYLALSTNKGNKRIFKFLNLMKQNGVDNEVIEKISYKNAQRFFGPYLYKQIFENKSQEFFIDNKALMC